MLLQSHSVTKSITINLDPKMSKLTKNINERTIAQKDSDLN